MQLVFERPKTQPKSIPPKVIVLGSTGRIGRRVIRQLMSLESDITVVAFVRDYERACEVLYDELLIERNAKGPKLQLVVMDLVPKSFVAGYNPKVENEDEDDEEYSVSASRFYKNDLEDYDFRTSKFDDALDLNPYLPMKDAITNATAIISTVGTVRSTIPFADYLLKPWRIFLSPRIWCIDASHPYYVNYMAHKKVLEYCEEALHIQKIHQMGVVVLFRMQLSLPTNSLPTIIQETSLINNNTNSEQFEKISVIIAL